MYIIITFTARRFTSIKHYKYAYNIIILTISHILQSPYRQTKCAICFENLFSCDIAARDGVRKLNSRTNKSLSYILI